MVFIVLLVYVHVHSISLSYSINVLLYNFQSVLYLLIVVFSNHSSYAKDYIFIQAIRESGYYCDYHNCMTPFTIKKNELWFLHNCNGNDHEACVLFKEKRFALCFVQIWTYVRVDELIYTMVLCENRFWEYIRYYFGFKSLCTVLSLNFIWDFNYIFIQWDLNL